MSVQGWLGQWVVAAPRNAAKSAPSPGPIQSGADVANASIETPHHAIGLGRSGLGQTDLNPCAIFSIAAGSRDVWSMMMMLRRPTMPPHSRRVVHGPQSSAHISCV